MGAGAGFMDGSICYRIEVGVVSICIMTGGSFGIPVVIAFFQKSIGGVAVGTFSLQKVWYVCTCLPRGNQVDGLPRAASFIAQAQGKSWRKWQADFSKIFSQNRRFLAILSTDFREKLSDLR